MTMLDQNRAVTQLAQKAGVDTTAVSNLAIWGNHSSTMYPDFYNARIGGRPAIDVIRDEAWFKDTFLPTVQQRGAAIIKARGLSSAASAANAVVDTVRNLTTPTREGDWFSVAVCSDGSYGIEKGLIYSYPIRSDGSKWEIVQGLQLTDFLATEKSKIVSGHRERAEGGEAPRAALVSELLPKSPYKPHPGRCDKSPGDRLRCEPSWESLCQTSTISRPPSKVNGCESVPRSEMALRALP
jgi:malate dehydrogenase